MPSEYAEQRLMALLGRLIDRSKAGQIKWTPTDRDGSFQMAAEKASVIITCRDNDGAPPFELTLLDASGNFVEKLGSDGYEDRHGYHPAEWNKPLAELWDIARRKAMNIDAVLDSLLAELSDDDIPF